MSNGPSANNQNQIYTNHNVDKSYANEEKEVLYFLINLIPRSGAPPASFANIQLIRTAYTSIVKCS